MPLRLTNKTARIKKILSQLRVYVLQLKEQGLN